MDEIWSSTIKEHWAADLLDKVKPHQTGVILLKSGAIALEFTIQEPTPNQIFISFYAPKRTIKEMAAQRLMFSSLGDGFIVAQDQCINRFNPNGELK